MCALTGSYESVEINLRIVKNINKKPIETISRVQGPSKNELIALFGNEGSSSSAKKSM